MDNQQVTILTVVRHLKTASYLFRRRPFRLEKPVVLQFPVIDICNSQCQMCRIWENKKSDDISPQELRTGLRNPLYSKVESVGLNGGEPTLRKDLGELAGVLFQELPALRYVSLITNGYRYQEVIDRIVDVGTVVRQHGGKLDVMVSLDGFGEMHDRVRGKPGNFERSQKVIEFIKSSPLVSSVRIGCTIIRENVYGLEDLFEYCKSEDLYIKYRLGIPHQRLYTGDLTAPYALTFEERYHMCEFLEGLIAHYEQGEQQKFFYRSLIDQVLHHAPRRAGCEWQHRGATISSRGDLLYCAVQSRNLGRIQQIDSQAVYFSGEPHLQEILRTKCADCSHDYTGIAPRGQQLRQLVNAGLRKTGGNRLKSLLRKVRFVSEQHERWRFSGHRKAVQSLLAAVPDTRPRRESGPSRVLICGWYGTETLGDKAILGGIVNALQAALGATELTLASLFPYVSKMTREQLPELRGCRIVSATEAISMVAANDLVLFGGGPIMAIDQLAEMEAIFMAARRCGVPAIIAGCGVGPLGSSTHDASLKQILALASVRIYRDEKSRAAAHALGIDTTRDVVAEDPAFLWLRGMRGKLPDLPAAGRRVLLLGLREFPHAQYARHLSAAGCKTAQRRYESAVIAALEQLAGEDPALVIRPLPMCTNHFGGDDRWFYRRLFRGNVRLAQALDLSLLGRELAPQEYCAAFRTASIALTMRFHSLVFALGLEVPAVAVDYTLGKGKVHALAERFGVPQQQLDQLDAALIVEQVRQASREPRAQAVGFEPAFAGALRDALAKVGLQQSPADAWQT